MASNMSSVSTAADKEKGPRAKHIVELPAEVLVKILGFLSFKNVSQCRLVSKLSLFYKCLYFIFIVQAGITFYLIILLCILLGFTETKD